MGKTVARLSEVNGCSPGCRWRWKPSLRILEHMTTSPEQYPLVFAGARRKGSKLWDAAAPYYLAAII
jgi:hypothetical protein